MSRLDAILHFLIPAGLSLALTPVAIVFARLVGAMDKPNARKVHRTPIPRMGGVAIAVSFLFMFGIGAWIIPAWQLSIAHTSEDWIILAAALVMVTALGVWDDIKSQPAGRKFLVQAFVATWVCLAGVRFTNIWLFGNIVDLGWLSYPISILWIVGITNALNLIDGLDGLAAGVAMIASLALAAIAAASGNWYAASMGLMLGGAILGFLRYNFNPAKTFLGDTGSLFLGFALATLSIEATRSQGDIATLFVPAVVLGLPIADTLISMSRRYLRTLMPSEIRSGQKESTVRVLFTPDKSHIHHQLLSHGFAHRTVVLMLYGVALILGASAYVIHVTSSSIGSFLLLIVLGVVILGIQQLRYKELTIHRNGILFDAFARFYEWPVLKRTIFQAVGDVAFISLAYFVGVFLTGYLGASTPELSGGLFAAALGIAAQVAAFWLSGVYKESTKLMGVADAVRITRATLYAVAAMCIVIFAAYRELPSVPFILVDFFALHLLMVLTRFSYSALHYILTRDYKGRRRALIYGANNIGLTILEMLLSSDTPPIEPVGFLDEDPRLEGKSMHGYPVFGGHRKLRRVNHLHGIDEIIIPQGSMQPSLLTRVREQSEEEGIALREFAVAMKPLWQEHRG